MFLFPTFVWVFPKADKNKIIYLINHEFTLFETDIKPVVRSGRAGTRYVSSAAA